METEACTYLKSTIKLYGTLRVAFMKIKRLQAQSKGCAAETGRLQVRPQKTLENRIKLYLTESAFTKQYVLTLQDEMKEGTTGGGREGKARMLRKGNKLHYVHVNSLR